MNPQLARELRKYFNDSHKVVAYLATVDCENNFLPEIRPVTLIEMNWQFYIVTASDSRKVKEITRHPRAAFIVPFRDNDNAGYLRVAGRISQVADVEIKKRAIKLSKYPIEHFSKNISDPKIYFAQIIPERAEYLKPGKWKATDMTGEFQF